MAPSIFSPKRWFPGISIGLYWIMAGMLYQSIWGTLLGTFVGNVLLVVNGSLMHWPSEEKLGRDVARVFPDEKDRMEWYEARISELKELKIKGENV